MVRKGCRVTFKRGGGTIRYPDGRKIKFVERLGVFFVALNVLEPELVTESTALVVRHEHDGAVQGFARPDQEA